MPIARSIQQRFVAWQMFGRGIRPVRQQREMHFALR